MIRKTFMVGCEQGFHMRPAQVFMETAMHFEAEITVLKEDEEANARSILSLMSLGLEKGSEVAVQIDGVDEAAAMETIQTLFETNFGE